MSKLETFQSITRACICGATWKLAGNAPGTKALADKMESMHSGEGHAPCTPAQAKRIRREEEALIDGWDNVEAEA